MCDTPIARVTGYVRPHETIGLEMFPYYDTRCQHASAGMSCWLFPYCILQVLLPASHMLLKYLELNKLTPDCIAVA